jgi:two-component system response regulator CpxR
MPSFEDDASTASRPCTPLPATSPQRDAKILLIDDDRQLGSMLADYFVTDRLDLIVCTSGEEGLQKAAADNFDLLILDIMLPGLSGLEVLQRVRRSSDVPVIMLTARGDDVDRIIGLEFGADDYLPKPFNPRELLARIKAILRRSQRNGGDTTRLELNGIELDLRTHRVTVGGHGVRVTGTEFEILRCLLETPGKVVSKEQLSERALGRRLMPYDRSIDTHISNLRGKLERSGSLETTIQNQRGVGYLLIPGN